MTFRIRSVFVAAALVSVGVLSACGNQAAKLDQDPLKDNPSFAAIPRDVSAAEVNARQAKIQAAGGSSATASVDAGQSFYLAISKSAIGERFFFTGYLKQLNPGGVYSGAASSMGARIVTFQIQNGKLFLIDASKYQGQSTTFTPETIIEAYPIVTDSSAFAKSGSNSRYVLIDPASGLNHFNLFSDYYAADPNNSATFTVDLSFLQRFRQISDGVTYEQVFTGQSDQPLHYTDCVEGDPTSCGEPNTYRMSGTLGVSIRKYSEGSNYTQVPLPRTGEYYFRSDPVMIPNNGSVQQVAAHWDIHPGMKPIQWKISRSVLAYQKLPQYQDVDIVGALTRGVENWNSVFGFKALEASVASKDDSFGDDDTNYVLFDEDPNFGAAFANWRTNPDTGEIRGASVYYSALWLDAANYYWPAADASGDSAQSSQTNFSLSRPRHKPVLGWGLPGAKPLCLRTPHLDAKVTDLKSFSKIGLLNPAAQLSATERKATFENFITHILLHEIGHTLGLRHNFKGSLVPPSSSVMEYSVETDDPKMPVPQVYDVAAVKYLYGLAKTEPTVAPFCTDEQVAGDGDCTRFDATANPFKDYWAPTYASQLIASESEDAGGLTYDTILGMLKYVSESSFNNPGRNTAAYHAVFDSIQSPLNAKELADNSDLGPTADLITVLSLETLYDPGYQALLSLMFGVSASTPADPAVNALAVQTMRAELFNADGQRGYDSRRLMVGMLKGQQTTDAFQALVDAQAALTADINGGKLKGADLLNSKDLLTLITQAVTPYYN